MRIMIVEDEQRTRRGLKRLILSVSPEADIVAEADNGRNALELIRTLKPDMVFTDIHMPLMDGLTLIREVRRLRMTTKFVIISVSTEFEYARQAISLGVSDYLVKPLTIEDIVHALKAVRGTDQEDSDSSEEPVSLAERYSDAHPVILRALRKIETDYASNLNQRQLASQLGITPEYFSALFKKNVGVSFVRFLRNYRIEIAKSLYRNGGVPRNEVPARVGFPDEKYFHHVFKEVTGMCVGEFIRDIREDPKF